MNRLQLAWLTITKICLGNNIHENIPVRLKYELTSRETAETVNIFLKLSFDTGCM